MRKLRDFSGIVLAAGFGTRLRPFTDKLPKPLVPLLNRTPLWHQIMLLKNQGITKIYINLHYKPEPVKDYIGKNLSGVRYVYEPQILGTGGGIRNIINTFGINEPVIVLNGDTITVADIREMILFYKKMDCDAVMLLIRDRNIPYENSVFADKKGRIRYIKQKPKNLKGLVKFRFLGVHILNPKVFEYLPEEGCINKNTYPRLIENGFRVYGFITKNDSFDIGKPENLYRANFAFLGKKWESSVFTAEYRNEITDSYGNITGKNVKIENSVIRNSVIGDNVTILDSEIRESLIFPDTLIVNEKLKRCVANNEYKYIISDRRGGRK